MSRIAAALAVLLLSAPAFAGSYFDDPLTSASFAGRGSRGGTFGPGGWTTTSGTDTVWYEIPDPTPTGRIEYTITGLSVGGTLSGSDHDLLAVYQSPGLPEPVTYMPYFRNNDLKVFTRLFGSAETGRGGAFKLEFAFCPQGAPWYHDTCPATCDQGSLAYATGRVQDIGWDPAKSYRMALYWKPGRMAFARDGVELGAVTYNGEYAGKPLRVRLGSPRHGGTLEFMPIGITIRDVHIEGTPGSQTLACGAPPAGPDAGSAGPDAAAPGPDASVSGSTTVYSALQDATAVGAISGVSPEVNDLSVQAYANGTPEEITYLRFPAVSGAVTRAVLSLRTASFGSAAGGSGVVYAVTDTSWSEGTLTFANKPSWLPGSVGTAKSVSPDEEVEFDVTSLVAKGVTSFAVVSADTNGAHYLSKEAGGATRGPRLAVTVDATRPDAGTPPGADAGTTVVPADAAVGGVDAAANPQAPNEEPPPSSQSGSAGTPPSADDAIAPGSLGTVEGGCGCSSSSGLPEVAGLLFAALAVVARRRR